MILSNHFWTWADRFLTPLDDPGSRLFHWNILVAFALVLVWAFWLQKSSPSSLKAVRSIFSRKYWWNRSTRRDYLIYLLNSLFKVFLFLPLLDCSFEIARFLSQSLVRFTGDFAGLKAGYWSVAVFTCGSFIFDDFLRFYHHRLMHRVPVLWRIHSLHHSAKVLTPFTLYRIHPLESAMATVRNAISLGVSAGLFVYIFESQLSVWTIAGVNVFGFLFNILGANLRHSHVPLRFPKWVEVVFISPMQHQIHHSSAPGHRDLNFGVSLAFWDKLFGSWTPSDKTLNLRFGLGNQQQRPWLKELGL